MKTLCASALSRNAVAFAVLVTPVGGHSWPKTQNPPDQQKYATGADSTVYEVRGDVKAPRPLSTPLPTPPARTDKQRKVVASFVVTSDGGVRDVKVVKRFKPDFDTAAVNAVASWNFEPATKAGKAVAVRLETEIKFTPQ